jgi:hypothetical protein
MLLQKLRQVRGWGLLFLTFCRRSNSVHALAHASAKAVKPNLKSNLKQFTLEWARCWQGLVPGRIEKGKLLVASAKAPKSSNLDPKASPKIK